MGRRNARISAPVGFHHVIHYRVPAVRKREGSGVDVTCGAELKIRLTDDASPGFETMRYELGTTDQDAELFGASLEYRFGHDPAR